MKASGEGTFLVDMEDIASSNATGSCADDVSCDDFYSASPGFIDDSEDSLSLEDVILDEQAAPQTTVDPTQELASAADVGIGQRMLKFVQRFGNEDRPEGTPQYRWVEFGQTEGAAANSSSSLSSLGGSLNSSRKLCAALTLPPSHHARMLMIKRSMLLASSRSAVQHATLGAECIATCTTVAGATAIHVPLVALAGIVALLSTVLSTGIITAGAGRQTLIQTESYQRTGDGSRISSIIENIRFDNVGPSLFLPFNDIPTADQSTGQRNAPEPTTLPSHNPVTLQHFASLPSALPNTDSPQLDPTQVPSNTMHSSATPVLTHLSMVPSLDSVGTLTSANPIRSHRPTSDMKDLVFGNPTQPTTSPKQITDSPVSLSHVEKNYGAGVSGPSDLSPIHDAIPNAGPSNDILDSSWYPSPNPSIDENEVLNDSNPPTRHVDTILPTSFSPRGQSTEFPTPGDTNRTINESSTVSGQSKHLTSVTPSNAGNSMVPMANPVASHLRSQSPTMAQPPNQFPVFTEFPTFPSKSDIMDDGIDSLSPHGGLQSSPLGILGSTPTLGRFTSSPSLPSSKPRLTTTAFPTSEPTSFSTIFPTSEPSGLLSLPLGGNSALEHYSLRPTSIPVDPWSTQSSQVPASLPVLNNVPLKSATSVPDETTMPSLSGQTGNPSSNPTLFGNRSQDSSSMTAVPRTSRVPTHSSSHSNSIDARPCPTIFQMSSSTAPSSLSSGSHIGFVSDSRSTHPSTDSLQGSQIDVVASPSVLPATSPSTESFRVTSSFPTAISQSEVTSSLTPSKLPTTESHSLLPTTSWPTESIQVASIFPSVTSRSEATPSDAPSWFSKSESEPQPTKIEDKLRTPQPTNPPQDLTSTPAVTESIEPSGTPRRSPWIEFTTFPTGILSNNLEQSTTPTSIDGAAPRPSVSPASSPTLSEFPSHEDFSFFPTFDGFPDVTTTSTTSASVQPTVYEKDTDFFDMESIFSVPPAMELSKDMTDDQTTILSSDPPSNAPSTKIPEMLTSFTQAPLLLSSSEIRSSSPSVTAVPSNGYRQETELLPIPVDGSLRNPVLHGLSSDLSSPLPNHVSVEPSHHWSASPMHSGNPKDEYDPGAGHEVTSFPSHSLPMLSPSDKPENTPICSSRYTTIPSIVQGPKSEFPSLPSNHELVEPSRSSSVSPIGGEKSTDAIDSSRNNGLTSFPSEGLHTFSPRERHENTSSPSSEVAVISSVVDKPGSEFPSIVPNYRSVEPSTGSENPTMAQIPSDDHDMKSSPSELLHTFSPSDTPMQHPLRSPPVTMFPSHTYRPSHAYRLMSEFPSLAPIHESVDEMTILSPATISPERTTTQDDGSSTIVHNHEHFVQSQSPSSAPGHLEMRTETHASSYTTLVPSETLNSNYSEDRSSPPSKTQDIMEQRLTLAPTGSSLELAGMPLLPTFAPTLLPSFDPSSSPMLLPTSTPSESPTAFPSASPSTFPTKAPFSMTSMGPSGLPSTTPSSSPSWKPSTLPSSEPSVGPSAVPSLSPSGVPSGFPSTKPSIRPTHHPSERPSMTPSVSSSAAPSVVPTRTNTEPSHFPSSSPTDSPSAAEKTTLSADPSMPSIPQLPTDSPSHFSDSIGKDGLWSQPPTNRKPSLFPTVDISVSETPISPQQPVFESHVPTVPSAVDPVVPSLLLPSTLSPTHTTTSSSPSAAAACRIPTFVLWDTTRRQPLQELSDGMVVCQRGDQIRFNIEVVLSDGCDALSSSAAVHMVFHGPKPLRNVSRVERLAPYFVFGNVPERLYGRWLRVGPMRVRAELYNDALLLDQVEMQVHVQTEGC